MRENHLMEDENELPYLVWENKDDDRSKTNSYYSDDAHTNIKSKSNEKKIDEILAHIPISASQRRALKDKVISLFSARDCVNLNVEGSGSAHTILFSHVKMNM